MSLYKIGDAYFVEDGNHRVSVARYQGVQWIDAEVVELRVPVAALELVQCGKVVECLTGVRVLRPE